MCVCVCVCVVVFEKQTQQWHNTEKGVVVVVVFLFRGCPQLSVFDLIFDVSQVLLYVVQIRAAVKRKVSFESIIQ